MSSDSYSHPRNHRLPAPRRTIAAVRMPPRALAPTRPITIDDRRAVALLTGIALLLVARGAAATLPSMWAWGLNLNRFVTPALGWLPWAVCALLLVPALGRAVGRRLEGVGDALTGGRGAARIAWAALGAALVWSLPDRLQHAGDFLLRQRVARGGGPFEHYFPQAFPLDVALHLSGPHLLMQRTGIDVFVWERILGALEAGIMAWLAASFARALGTRGAAAVAVTAVAFFGGYLAMFTGYGKAFKELTVLVAAAGVLAMRCERDGRGLVAMGLVVSFGIATHRLALGLVPVWLAVLLLSIHRRHVTPIRWPMWIAGAAVPLATLAWMAPRILSSVGQYDRGHFVVGAAAVLDVLMATLVPLRLVDLANMVVVLSPLAWALPILMRPGSGHGAATSFRLLLALAIPFVAVAFVYHPPQGVFRDWDDHATAGVALSLLTAWLIAMATRSRHGGWLATVATLCVVVPTIQILAVQASPERGRARVQAFLDEAPSRPPVERALTREYLGLTALLRDDGEDAARHYRAAAADVASPGILRGWAIAEALCGRPDSSRAICRRLVERNPGDLVGWRGLMKTAYVLNNIDEARRAAAALLSLAPDDPDARLVLERTGATPEGILTPVRLQDEE